MSYSEISAENVPKGLPMAKAKYTIFDPSIPQATKVKKIIPSKPQTSSTCVKRTTKRHRERPSPPYESNDCPGESKKGNDGHMYESRKYMYDSGRNGYRWYKKKPEKKTTATSRGNDRGKGKSNTTPSNGKRDGKKSTTSIVVSHNQLVRIMKGEHPTHTIATAASDYLRGLLQAVGNALVGMGVSDHASVRRMLDRVSVSRMHGFGYNADVHSRLCEQRYAKHVGGPKETRQPMRKRVGSMTGAAMAGLVFDTGTTVAINALLESLAARILGNAGNLARDIGNTSRINMYFVKLAVAGAGTMRFQRTYIDGDILKFLSFLKLNPDASLCMPLPSYSKTRKAPPYDATFCHRAGEVTKTGLDGNTYKTVRQEENHYTWKKVN